MRSRLLSEINEMAAGLTKSGVVTKTTLREIEAEARRPKQAFTAAQIKNIRRKAGLSQSVFAIYMNTSVSTVQKWERGQNHPQGSSVKLLSLIEQ
ncbi:MAG: transcriptional regulator, partial [Cyanobacteria bacterium PR.023]|nr:transcriptional regulator [Cyanobacteria bacterium PR.023]